MTSKVVEVEDPAALAISWREIVDSGRAEERETYIGLARALLRNDVALVAYDVTKAGLVRWPRDSELRWLKALALATAGATHKANKLALELYDEGRTDDDTLGLLGRTYREMAGSAAPLDKRQHYLLLARGKYEEAYNTSRTPYPGINAASLALVTGETELSAKLALEVRDNCKAKLELDSEEDADYYWTLATLAEADLLLGRHDEALAWYQQACQHTRRRFRWIRSTRRSARLICDHLESQDELASAVREQIDGCFRMPRVVAFVGHMVDKENRECPRFPSQLSQRVYEEILPKLKSFGDVVGYSSAACGSDILFQEAVREAGGQSRIVLPYDPTHFGEHSVAFAGGDWLARYDRVLQQATEVTVVSPKQRLTSGSVSYDYANQVLTGLAMSLADRFDSDFTPLAVWDGQLGDGPGGTASVVKRWESQGLPVEIVDLSKILKNEGFTATSPMHRARRRRPAAASATDVMAIMFVDVQNFTKLTEEQMPFFVEHFLYMIGAKAAVSPNHPVVKESRGDGVYLVFDRVGKAGRFALELNEALDRISWAEYGLPADLSVRIALHAGPVYRYVCPFSREVTYTGSHVNRTARIEPITPAGEVYVSREFAALASETNVRDFECDYAGLVPLAQEYGTFPIYHLRPRQSRAAPN